jgi:MFS family permease
MLGQFLLLSAMVWLSAAPIRNTITADVSTRARPEALGRSGLSGILILLSLGAVLLSPLVWFLPVEAVWKSFFSVLFIVALVTILVWITDRFDDTVAYLREYVRRVHQSKLVSGLAEHPPESDRFALYRARHLSGRIPRFGCATEAGRVPRPERLYAP